MAALRCAGPIAAPRTPSIRASRYRGTIDRAEALRSSPLLAGHRTPLRRFRCRDARRACVTNARARAISEARLLDIEVGSEELDFVANRSQRPAGMIQNVPEHLRQPQRHPFRARRISDHEIGNGVQTVEQKMWIDLRPQRPQLGL